MGKRPQSLKEEQAMLQEQRQEDQEAEKLKRNEEITLDGITSDYLKWAQDNKKSWYDDKSRYLNHIKPMLGDHSVSSLCVFDGERLKNKLKKQGKADATIKHCLVLVRQIINKALLWGLWTGKNPFKGITIPVPDNKRNRFLSQDEAERLLQECRCRSQQLYEICLCSLHTGMRAGEIFNLTWNDLDFDKGTIFIRNPKNNESRTTYMTDDAKVMFTNKPIGNFSDFVFRTKTGQKLKNISKAFSRAVDAIGINDNIQGRTDKVVFHTLRHTFASWLVQDGQDLYLIQQLLGHKDSKMTQRYAHLAPDGLRKGIERINDIVNQNGGLSQQRDVQNIAINNN